MGTTRSQGISASERSTLMKLLEEDFNTLRAEVRNEASQFEASEKRRVREEHVERIGQARVLEDRIREIIREAGSQQFSVKLGSSSYDNHAFNIEDKTLDAARKEVEGHVSRERDRALLIVSREESKAKRDLLRKTLTNEAVELLDALPSAASIMERARAELAPGPTE